MHSGLVGVPFGGESESSFFPVGVGAPGFLLSAHVDAGGVDFVVALLLEVVEAFVEIVEAGDAGSFVDVGAECHQPKDDLGSTLAQILRAGLGRSDVVSYTLGLGFCVRRGMFTTITERNPRCILLGLLGICIRCTNASVEYYIYTGAPLHS